MIFFAVLFGFRHIVLLTFGLGMMAKASQHDTTPSPDDQDDRKSVDSDNQDADNFRTGSGYLSAILDSQKTEYNDLPIIYHTDKADGDEEFQNENTRSVSPLVSENDLLVQESADGDGMVKRLGRNLKQGGRKYKYDPALRLMGLGKRDVRKFQYDPALKLMGLGKRDSRKFKYDPALKFMGLGKRDGRKFKYDPALKFMGLGKRDKDRPKYNPGWKFIGLGKRELLEPEVDPSMFKMVELERRDYKLKTTDEVHPYLSLLALGNLRNFLEAMKGEIGRMSRKDDPEKSSIDDQQELHSSQTDKNTVPVELLARQSLDKNSPGSSQTLFTRSRKPTRFWKNKSKPIYDPGWVMTGLGK